MDTKDELLGKLRPLFEQYSDDIIAVYIFGSVAQGNADRRSDLDIAVLPDSCDRPYLLELKDSLYVDLCRVLTRNDIDLVVLKLAKNLLLIDHIIHKGYLLWEKDVVRRKEYEVEKLHEILDFKGHRFSTMGI